EKRHLHSLFTSQVKAKETENKNHLTPQETHLVPPVNIRSENNDVLPSSISCMNFSTILIIID
ncbi:hypothetical protein L9F63_008560, partial [Diploptera punctata]